MAITAPVIKAFSAQYPGTKITVLSKEIGRPIFELIPGVDFYAAEVKGRHAGFRGLLQLSKELRDLKIDAVADMHDVLRSKVVRKILLLFGIPYKVIDKGRTEKKLLISGSPNGFKQLKPTVNRYSDVFRALGFSLDLSQNHFLDSINISEDVQNEISWDNKKINIGIAPFAAFQGKVYPFESMDKVIEGLSKQENTTIYLFGGGENEVAQLQKSADSFNNVVNIAGKFSLARELELISNLKCMLAMDSGNAHLAAMFGVKVVTLWGITHPFAGFYPYGQDPNNALFADRLAYPLIPTSVYGNKAPEGYKDCMKTIEPEMVIEKIRQLTI